MNVRKYIMVPVHTFYKHLLLRSLTQSQSHDVTCRALPYLPSDKHLTRWYQAAPAYVPLPPDGIQRCLSAHHFPFASPRRANLSINAATETPS